MKPHNIYIGKQGEQIAEEYFIKNNCEILEKNFRAGHGEIDLIVKENDTILFVEVKTRTNTNFGTPIESITEKKINILKETANRYLFEKNFETFEYRFDFIGIKLKKTTFELSHIKNCF